MSKIIGFLIICQLILLGLLPAVVLADCTNSNTNTTSDTNTATTTPVVYSTDIYLSELLPNPSSDETSNEFIELYNAGTTTVDLTSWMLSDATDKTYTLSGSLRAGDYLAVYRSDSGIALNNTGDTTELYNPNTVLQDSIEYVDSADADTSYVLTSTGDWVWTTTPTPNAANRITAPVVAATNTTVQQTADTTANTNTATTAQYDLSTKIQLSELLPDPAGSDATDEWIELYNTDSRTVDLTGWQIVDSSHAFTIDAVSINASGYALFGVTDTSISLNNSGETIQLVDPTSATIDSVTYPAATTGESYARSGASWAWTATLTPNAANVMAALNTATTNPVNAATDPTTTGETTNAAVTSDTNTSNLLTIAVAKQQDSSTSVVVQGVVSVLPATFSSSYFYIQDATSGVQVYSSSKTFPSLAVGDTVQVTGTIGTSNGEMKINTSSADDIIVVNSGTTITPWPVTSFVVDNAGQVVQVTGLVSTKSGSTITLDSGWIVYIKHGTGISTTSFVVGNTVTVAGVLISTADGVQVWPRSATDITITTTTAAPATASGTTSVSGTLDTTNANPTAQHQTSNQTFSIPNVTQAAMSFGVLGWLCVAAGLALLVTLLWRSERLKNLVRKWISAKVHGWERESDHSVESEKNTTDLNAPTQYHELHLWNKIPS